MQQSDFQETSFTAMNILASGHPVKFIRKIRLHSLRISPSFPSCLVPRQATQLLQSDASGLSFRSIQQKALAGSSIRYIDVLPMTEARPDGHIQNWSTPGTVQ